MNKTRDPKSYDNPGREINPDPRTMPDGTCFCEGKIHPEGKGKQWHILPPPREKGRKCKPVK